MSRSSKVKVRVNFQWIDLENFEDIKNMQNVQEVMVYEEMSKEEFIREFLAQ